jgi:site-specific DNA-methyltransferase (adenine-specific)
MIVNQDCLEWMQQQPDHTIDIIVSSPPYNRDIAYNGYKDRRTDYLEWQEAVWSEACRILKPTGHLFLNICGNHKDPFLAYEVARSVPWRVQNNIVWAKSIEFKGHIYGRSTVNINSKYVLPHGHETIWHFTEQGKTPISLEQSSVGYRPEFAEDNYRRTGRRTRPTTTCWHIPYETTGYMGKDAKTVKGLKGHPAIFPRELVRHCLNVAGAQPGQRVYDPFGGTGTTAVVAKEMGLDWVITEIDSDYVAFITERMQPSRLEELFDAIN